MTAKYFAIPFASSGDVATVPDSIQIDGSVSYTQGYGPLYQTAVGSGGINIERTKMNELFLDITTALQQYQQHGTPDYYAAITAGAGYSKYDRVRYTDGKTYTSLINSNTSLPTVSTAWSLDQPTQDYALDTGVANAYVIALTPPITAYYNGLIVTWKVKSGNTSTGASTLDAGAGAATLVNDAGGAIAANDLVALSIVTSVYDGATSQFYVTEVVASQIIPTLPLSNITGTSHTFANAEQAHLVTRSNSGTAMTDTLPGTSGALSNGWFTYIENKDSTASNTVAVGGGGTINQGLNTGSFIIAPGETWLVQSQGTGVYNVGRVISSVLHAAPVNSSIKNLAAAYASTTTMTITADEVVLEDSTKNTRRALTLNSTINCATTGANALDTGALGASSWYYVFAIFNATTNTVAAIASLSSTAPTLPAGYTFQTGCISTFRTNGSSQIIGFKQVGRDWQYMVGSNLSTALQMANGSAGSPTGGTYVAVSVSNFVPTAVAGVCKLYLGGTLNVIIAAPNNSYGAIASTTNPPPVALPGGSGGATSSLFEFVLESTNVYWANSGTGAMYVLGFRLNM